MPEVSSDMLDALIDDGLIQHVAGDGRRYRLPAAIRDAGLQSWIGDEARLTELSDQLAAFWHDERPAEALYHLLATAPASAARMFEELFVQAEERFDLAACETLLASLDEHLPATRRRPSARDRATTPACAWRADCSGPTTGTAPGASSSARTWRKPLDALLADRRPSDDAAPCGGWHGQDHAPALAHRPRVCAPRGIACARIDFDAVEPDRRALRSPGSSCSRIADQLNRQLARRRRSRTLLTHGRWRGSLPRLWRPPQRGPPQNRADSVPVGDRRRSTRSRCARAINRLDPATRRSCIVIDTLEAADAAHR